jgi:predicted flap endonuclease-1-like 5' DNA nuclease
VAWFIGQSFAFVAVAFVLGVLVGWLWWGRRGRTGAPALATATAPAPIVLTEEPPEPVAEPEPAAVPEPVAADRDDDLERIEGIGPKMAAALRAAGIRTYAALADSDEASLRLAIERAGMSFAPSIVTWARQARLLADGDEEGFADLARRLVAGRDVGRS